MEIYREILLFSVKHTHEKTQINRMREFMRNEISTIQLAKCKQNEEKKQDKKSIFFFQIDLKNEQK